MGDRTAVNKRDKMREVRIPSAALVFAFSLGSVTVAQVRSVSEPSPLRQTPASSATKASAPAVAQPQAPPQKVTKYTLPPERFKKARDLARIHFRFTLISVVYGLVVLWLVLRWKISAKYRTWAEQTSSKRFLQAVVFFSLLVLTIGILGLPAGGFPSLGLRRSGIP